VSKEDGTVSLFFVVDTEGVPRNITFDQPLGSDLDRFALRILAEDRFKPGTLNGSTVVVAQRDELVIQTCLTERSDRHGKNAYKLRLRSKAEQSFSNIQREPVRTILATPVTSEELENGTAQIYKPGGSVTPPVRLKLKLGNIDFTDEAILKRISGTCVFSVIVDSQGIPHNVKLLNSLGYGLDESATQRVRSYRYKPAMKDGEPVPAKITVEVNFLNSGAPSS
jgi:protein TonB